MPMENAFHITIATQQGIHTLEVNPFFCLCFATLKLNTSFTDKETVMQ